MVIIMIISQFCEKGFSSMIHRIQSNSVQFFINEGKRFSLSEKKGYCGQSLFLDKSPGERRGGVYKPQSYMSMVQTLALQWSVHPCVQWNR